MTAMTTRATLFQPGSHRLPFSRLNSRGAYLLLCACCLKLCKSGSEGVPVLHLLLANFLKPDGHSVVPGLLCLLRKLAIHRCGLVVLTLDRIFQVVCV